MSEDFVTVFTSYSVEEAHLARIRLAADGIEAHLTDEKTIGMDWSLANAMRGVKVQVKEADAETARKILDPNTSKHESIDDECFQSRDDVEVENSADQPKTFVETNGDREAPPRFLEGFRSLKYLVIGLVLAPSFFGVLVYVSVLLLTFMHKMGLV